MKLNTEQTAFVNRLRKHEPELCRLFQDLREQERDAYEAGGQPQQQGRCRVLSDLMRLFDPTRP